MEHWGRCFHSLDYHVFVDRRLANSLWLCAKAATQSKRANIDTTESAHAVREIMRPLNFIAVQLSIVLYCIYFTYDRSHSSRARAQSINPLCLLSARRREQVNTHSFIWDWRMNLLLWPNRLRCIIIIIIITHYTFFFRWCCRKCFLVEYHFFFFHLLTTQIGPAGCCSRLK